MPLSKKRDKARKRIERALAVQPKSNLNAIQPVEAKQTKLVELRQLIQATSSKSSAPKEEPRHNIPVYNPVIHGPGDRVLVQRGKKWYPYLVPEVDKDGNVIPDYW